MGLLLMNVNHVKILTLIVRQRELTIKSIAGVFLGEHEGTLTSRVHFLLRNKLIDVRREKYDMNYIFYRPTEAGIDLIRSLQEAIESVDSQCHHRAVS